MPPNQTWNTTNETWNSITYTWNEVALIIEAAAATAGGGIVGLQGWSKAKKKKLVKLVFRYKGVEHESSKEIKEYKISVEDIQLLAEDVKHYSMAVKF